MILGNRGGVKAQRPAGLVDAATGGTARVAIGDCEEPQGYIHSTIEKENTAVAVPIDRDVPTFAVDRQRVAAVCAYLELTGGEDNVVDAAVEARVERNRVVFG